MQLVASKGDAPNAAADLKKVVPNATHRKMRLIQRWFSRKLCPMQLEVLWEKPVPNVANGL